MSKDVMFKEGANAETLGRNGLFKTIGIIVNRFDDNIFLNPITSKRLMGRSYTEVPVESAVEFANAVLEAAGEEPFKLTYRELSTILAALRLFQSERDWGRDLPHFDDCTPLDDAEINELCERLNCDVEVTDGPDEDCGSCGVHLGPSTSFPWHGEDEDCRSIHEPIKEESDGPEEVSVKRE